MNQTTSKAVMKRQSTELYDVAFVGDLFENRERPGGAGERPSSAFLGGAWSGRLTQ
jgi:hypothetical protein